MNDRQIGDAIMKSNGSAPISNAPMLNLYPDSLGGSLAAISEFLGMDLVKGAFSSLYVLPSVFNTDLDRGFSVISYDLNAELASTQDLERIKDLGIDLKLDFLLNHASVLCEQFQDILENGEESVYRDFFIDWNRFWDGCGEMTSDGYIKPDDAYLKDMFFRKPGLPILMVRFPDGRNVPYWNTFYQEVRYPRVDEQDLMRLTGMQYQTAQKMMFRINHALDDGIAPPDISLDGSPRDREAIVEYLQSNRKYLGQMDLNIQSPMVWDYYEQTIQKLADYGASIVRLDAFAYAPKAPGKKNFLNQPDTWDLLERVGLLADKHHVTLLPEIHASYEEKIHEQIAEAGYICYDFFLPGLVIDAFERKNGETLCAWAEEIQTKGMRMVNMLGCHDGIPLLDLKGILPGEQIERLIDAVVANGGMVKDLHGQKNVYYQVNATFFSALGENERKMTLARAIQLFMPGKPQIWYLDLFAGKNDVDAVGRAGAGGHKEINRTNLSQHEIESRMQLKVVRDQLDLLKFRNAFPAFGFDSEFEVSQNTPFELHFSWRKDGYKAEMRANLNDCGFTVNATNPEGMCTYSFKQ